MNGAGELETMDQNNHYPMQSDLTRHSYSPPQATSAFKLDEGFSEDIRSQDEGGQVGLSASAPRFEEWVMAQSEEARAGKFTKFGKVFLCANAIYCNSSCNTRLLTLLI
jgi:hypothetical protein